MTRTSITALVLALLLGAGLGYLAAQTIHSTPSRSTIVRADSSEYKFINPILLGRSTDDTSSPTYDSLKSAISQYVNTAKATSTVSSISVYFRNMNSGEWTGVDENGTYAPGSMLKVGVMMGYLSAAAQNNPSLLDMRYVYEPQIDGGQYFKPAKVLAPGTYTATDLIKNMIIESDNTATLILANQHPDIVEQVYKDLNLPDPQVGADFMSPKQYAILWRVLYNATYLPRETSEEALDLLSLTTFDDGLVAGLPTGVRVAHKFGEHTDVYSDKPAVHELHDCGIVYPTGKDPYFLCVMTRGSDFNPLEKVISDISRLTYQAVGK